MTIAITKQEAQGQVKELEKLYNKEGQPALKNHYRRQLTKAKHILDTLMANDSFLKPMRTPWSKLPCKPWEAV